MSPLAFRSGLASTWRTVCFREISRRIAHDARAKEDRMGRFTRHSRSTTFGVKPATDSSEVAVTSPSFASAVQAAGTSKAKQVPVRVGFMTFRFLGFRSARPRVLVGAGPAVSGFPWGVP